MMKADALIAIVSQAGSRKYFCKPSKPSVYSSANICSCLYAAGQNEGHTANPKAPTDRVLKHCAACKQLHTIAFLWR